MKKHKRTKGERLNEGQWIMHNLLKPRVVGKKILYTGKLCMAQFPR